MTTLKSILHESTPICSDLINIIAEYAQPIKFKVDKVYMSDKNKKYIIVHRTKCFIDVLPEKRTYTMRFKIRYNLLGDEYLNLYGCELLYV
jgi:predicted transport protein